MRDIRLTSPLEGELIPLSAVKDMVFSTGAMGRGAAVRNPQGKVVAPFDGEITVFFETKHAIGLKSADGIEVLIHVGMDTVKLNGEHFTAQAAQGDKVKKGQVLLTFDPAAIREAGYDTTTPVVVTNAAEFGDITVEYGGQSITSKAAEDHSFDDLPDEQRVAKLIEKYVGGMENVRNAEHCATRLRLIVNDKSKIDEKAIENIDGVKGQFFAAAQYQIILGTGFVDKVYAEFVKGTNFSGVSNKEEAYAQMTTVQKISRTLGDVFVPIIPVLVATGLFMGLRGAAQSLGMEFSDNLLRMSRILTDTASRSCRRSCAGRRRSASAARRSSASCSASCSSRRSCRTRMRLRAARRSRSRWTSSASRCPSSATRARCSRRSCSASSPRSCRRSSRRSFRTSSTSS